MPVPTENAADPARDVRPAGPGAFPIERAAPPASTGSEPTSADETPPVLQETMREATRFYDMGDYENARATAVEVLNKQPNPHATERMLRIAASSSCFMGEPDQARTYFEKLTPQGQLDIARRCSRYGIEF